MHHHLNGIIQNRKKKWTPFCLHAWLFLCNILIFFLLKPQELTETKGLAAWLHGVLSLQRWLLEIRGVVLGPQFQGEDLWEWSPLFPHLSQKDHNSLQRLRLSPWDYYLLQRMHSGMLRPQPPFCRCDRYKKGKRMRWKERSKSGQRWPGSKPKCRPGQAGLVTDPRLVLTFVSLESLPRSQYLIKFHILYQNLSLC